MVTEAVFRAHAEPTLPDRGGLFLIQDLYDWCEARAGARGEGFIYFLEAVGADRIKIGHSLDVAKRRLELRTGCPFDLLLLATVDGGVTDETKMHKRFASARVMRADGGRSEWFRATPDLREFIASVAA